MAAPYRDRDAAAVSRMVESLEEYKRKKPGRASCKKTTFEVQDSTNGIHVDSWRFQDWDYKKQGLPTYARGLFTTTTSNGRPEIAVRGYDKFFNVDEVPATKWDTILHKTRGPYELTLKENGCIIFVAGLEDDTLLVCSKHSTGDRSDAELSHARAGEIRIEKQLAAAGKTKAELARELRSRNITAVAELCDDSFEEHILAYEGDKAGLYLHGINLNVPEFATYPSSLVQEFAERWGFLETNAMVLDDISMVRTFLENVAKTGAHDGRDVEGFVIRCKMSEEPKTEPYLDWFFKYKFEEPYLMYRQWRECTKALIHRKPPKFKKHTRITEEYLAFARGRLAEDPELGSLYSKNHGIIKLRDEFLQHKNMKGSDAAEVGELDRIVLSGIAKDVVLTPVATIGCGKTTIALALGHLFKWGHVQNDNISGKGRPPRFVKAIMDQLEEHPAVFADRNNIAKRERKQLITDVKEQKPRAKVVCLYFQHDQESMEDIKRITQERVLERGDNHQTFHAATDKEKFLNIMESFLKGFEECSPLRPPDSHFDFIINLDPLVGSRQNLETVVRELHKSLPDLVTEVPTAEQLDQAMEMALDYRPQVKHELPERGAKSRDNGNRKTEGQGKGMGRGNWRTQGDREQTERQQRLEYLSVDVPTGQVKEILERVFDGADPETSRFFKQLQQTRRVMPKFHVTLMHRASAKENPPLWKRYLVLHEDGGGGEAKIGSCDVLLERVVFDDRIMAIVVRLIDVDGEWECANRVAHITVGSRDSSIKPKESNALLSRWLDVGVGGEENTIWEVIIPEKPTLRGEVRGVLTR